MFFSPHEWFAGSRLSILHCKPVVVWELFIFEVSAKWLSSQNGKSWFWLMPEVLMFNLGFILTLFYGLIVFFRTSGWETYVSGFDSRNMVLMILLASGGPPGGPDFRNLDKQVWDFGAEFTNFELI